MTHCQISFRTNDFASTRAGLGPIRLYGVDDPYLAHSSAFSTPVNRECPETHVLGMTIRRPFLQVYKIDRDVILDVILMFVLHII